mgnify:CR=1 FL=1
MVSVRRVGGVPEPNPGRPADARERKQTDARDSSPQDGVRISSEAQAAAQVARLVEAAALEPDIRDERVAAARERIERGEYKRADVVLKVAEKIQRYLEE